MKRAPELPGWAQELRERYLAGEASLFLLHGNVRDLYPWEMSDGSVRYVPLRTFLEQFLRRSKDIVLYYNCSEGIEFADKDMNARFSRAINARRAREGQDKLGFLPSGPGEVLPLVEELFTDQSQSSAVVLDYVETIVPGGDLSFMSESDKANMVGFQRWASDPALLASDSIIILVTEQLTEVHRKVTSSPQLALIQLPLPDVPSRTSYIQQQSQDRVTMEMDVENLGKHTAGLSLVQIRGLFRVARQSGEEITFRMVSRRKKAIIEQECHGLVEFVDPGHDFSHVGGMERVKTDLMRIAEAIKKGHRNRVPMGAIFVGPMGTGKTYVAEAFAGESGLTCLKFKNFRDKWVGSTEGNLEKILQVVDGLGYVLLIIDEADRSLGGTPGENDGGTGSRVIARLKEFMSDTSHRGRVVILMMTNRPDKLDTDLKRPGRFDLKIPFFFPEEDEERRLILEAQLRKTGFQLEEGVDLSHAVEATKGYSAAELEAVLLAAAGFASVEDRLAIAQGDIDRAAEDVIPSRDTRMLEFMEMLAVFEASAKRMLPDRFQELSTEDVQQRLDQLRTILGRRVF
ncbi:MAG: ATP-binding protein [Alphaproteobacteria bacterium]|nr:ATP-binding protein [Alphaproteobacteria bacterium]MCB9792378.1 ATP-binding protein [Alphaproteobacteria bacterium]